MGFNTTSEFIQKQIDDFVASLIKKLEKRAAKHPEDNFLALDKESILRYPIAPLENHLIEEIAEFIATMDNPTPFLKDFAIRVLGEKDFYEHFETRTFEQKKVEVRDMANMCLILHTAWSVRQQ